MHDISTEVTGKGLNERTGLKLPATSILTGPRTQQLAITDATLDLLLACWLLAPVTVERLLQYGLIIQEKTKSTKYLLCHAGYFVQLLMQFW